MLRSLQHLRQERAAVPNRRRDRPTLASATGPGNLGCASLAALVDLRHLSTVRASWLQDGAQFLLPELDGSVLGLRLSCNFLRYCLGKAAPLYRSPAHLGSCLLHQSLLGSGVGLGRLGHGSGSALWLLLRSFGDRLHGVPPGGRSVCASALASFAAALCDNVPVEQGVFTVNVRSTNAFTKIQKVIGYRA